VNWRCRMEDSDESAISAMATTEEGGETAATAVMVTTEEDDEHAPTEEVWTSEEGGSSVAKQPARQGVDAVMEVADAEAMMLNDHLVPRTADVARVRMARKAAQREAKNHRILQATRRAAVKVEGVESVERVVKELDAEVVRRRRAQTAEAQEELMQRRARRPQVNLTETRRPDQRARVSLVKRAKGVAVVNAARGSSVEADDGLPTAIMDVNGEKHAVKWDSCARYSVAGTEWMERGERVRGPAPVDYVEGVGGFLLDVLGLWAFEMRNVFGQVVRVTACIVEGCTSEFLMGLDFLKKHNASMDFDANEVRYFEKELLVVIPFRTEGGDDGEARVAPVRMARQVKLARCAVTPVTIAVAGPDGEQVSSSPPRTAVRSC
jgi:uncharacterized protein YrzB (UPF0473 family)